MMSGFGFLITDYEQLLRLRSQAIGQLDQGQLYLETLESALVRLEALWEDLLGNPRFRLALAESSHTPTALLEWLAGDEEQEVRLAVARNPATPVTALSTLTQSWAGRLAVACNPCSPSEVLGGLAFDGDLDIRQALAANPNTPPWALTRLALDPDLSVHRKVALNPRTPPRLLWQLAQQANPTLHLALLRNPNTPKEALEVIVLADPDLLDLASHHPNSQISPQRPKIHPPEPKGVLNLDCPVCRSTQGQIYGSRRAS